jgi:hypothetical protein
LGRIILIKKYDKYICIIELKDEQPFEYLTLKRTNAKARKESLAHKYFFDIAQADEIFNQIMHDRQSKLIGNHLLPTQEQLNGKT